MLRLSAHGFFSVTLIITAVASLASSEAAANSRPKANDPFAYSSAFGYAAAANDTVSDDATDGAGEEPLNSLRQISSFPARVRVGGDGDMTWPDSNLRHYEPMPVEHMYKAGHCQFTVRTGDFTLRRYERKGSDLSVSLDPVDRFATLSVGPEPVLMSVNTEVYATVEPERKAACQKVFGNRRVYLGKIDLARTELVAQSDSGEAMPLATVSDAAPTAVYLVWDAKRNDIDLVDGTGLPPAVESPVFAIQPESEGDYYLAVNPEFGVQRHKHR